MPYRNVWHFFCLNILMLFYLSLHVMSENLTKTYLVKLPQVCLLIRIVQ